MPADTKAIRYEWFMVRDPEAQLVKWVWEPENGVITSSMGVGEMKLYGRQNPEDEWEQIDIKGINNPIPWAVAQSLARGQEANVEVVIHAS